MSKSLLLVCCVGLLLSACQSTVRMPWGPKDPHYHNDQLGSEEATRLGHKKARKHPNLGYEYKGD